MRTSHTESKAALNLADARSLVEKFNVAAQDNPRHPSLQLALRISRQLRLDDEHALTHDDLGAMIAKIDEDAALTRAKYNADYMGDMDIDNNVASLERALETFAYQEDGTLKSFEDFMRDTTGLHEVVLTGHPVFGMHPKKAQAIAEHAAHLAGDKTDRGNTFVNLTEVTHLSAIKPTLQNETAQAHEAMRNGHAAISMVEDAHIKVAKKLYPDEWMNGIYRPGRLGTWLKFDRDGRKDVTEFDSLAEYLNLQVMMFDDHIARLKQLESLLEFGQKPTIRHLIQAFSETRENLAYHSDAFNNYDKKKDMPRLERLVEMATQFVNDGASRIKHPGEAIATLQALKAETTNEEALTQTVKMISRLSHHGLAYAHAQFRVSSLSVSAAVRQQTHGKVSIKDSSSDDGKYTNALDDMITDADAQASNLIDVAQSKQTLVTQMMLIRQIRDEADQYTPIHFLIAETHNASTVLGALYVAKLAGVNRDVNIIPLLEDREGADHGSKVMEILMGLPSYMDHALGDRPHNPAQSFIASEHGYSDLSRYDGRVSAATFQEQAKIRILRQVEQHAGGRTLLIFDTQGQKPGRNQHPLSMADHHANLNTPLFLELARQNNVPLVLQKSVQGQDGFMLELGTPAAALRNMALAIENRVRQTEPAGKDAFYKAREPVKAFHKDARAVHAQFIADPGYTQMMSTLSGTLPPGGSRPVVGTYDGARKPKLPRAIVDNGTKDSFGFSAHMIVGLGSAINDDGTLYERVVTTSPIYRRLHLPFTMWAMERSDPGMARSFVELYNPDFWIERAKYKSDESQRAACYYLANHLGNTDMYVNFTRQVNVMSREYNYVQQAHDNLKLAEDRELDHPNLRPSTTQKFNTQILQAIKMAAMIDMFERVAQIPDVAADRNGIDKAELMDRVLNFDETALSAIGRIYESSHAQKVDFPAKPSGVTFETSYTGVAEDVTVPATRDMHLIKDAARPLQSYNMGVG